MIVSSGRRLIAKEETSDSPRSCRSPGSPRFRYSFEINYADERLFGARGDNDTIERNLMASEGWGPWRATQNEPRLVNHRILAKAWRQKLFHPSRVLFSSSFHKVFAVFFGSYTLRSTGVSRKILRPRWSSCAKESLDSFHLYLFFFKSDTCTWLQGVALVWSIAPTYKLAAKFWTEPIKVVS